MDKIKTEALKIARLRVKKAMKRKGVKISWFTSKEITKAARALLKYEPTIYDEAKKGLSNV